MEVLGARGPPRAAQEVVSLVRGFAEEHGVEIQPLDPAMVFGRDHLISAVDHALRARVEGRATSRTLAGEVLLYASGERQVGEALAKLGLKGRVEAAALVVLGSCPTGELLRRMGWARDDDLLRAEGKDPTAFGLAREELSTVAPGAAADLILERVALVDLMK